MTKGAVYSNFKNKEELIFAVLDDCMPSPDSPPTSVADDGTIDQRYKVLGETYAHLTNSPERRQFAMFIMEFWLFSMRNPMARERFLPVLRSVGRQWERVRMPPGHPLEGVSGSQLSGIASAVDFGIGIHSLLDAESFPPEIYGDVMKLIFSDVCSRCDAGH